MQQKYVDCHTHLAHAILAGSTLLKFSHLKQELLKSRQVAFRKARRYARIRNLLFRRTVTTHGWSSFLVQLVHKHKAVCDFSWNALRQERSIQWRCIVTEKKHCGNQRRARTSLQDAPTCLLRGSQLPCLRSAASSGRGGTALGERTGRHWKIEKALVLDKLYCKWEKLRQNHAPGVCQLRSDCSQAQVWYSS